jgi:hypothetical protein
MCGAIEVDLITPVLHCRVGLGGLPLSREPASPSTVFHWEEAMFPRGVRSAVRAVSQSMTDGGGVPVLPGRHPLALGDHCVLGVPCAGHASLEDTEPSQQGAGGQ